MEKITLLVHLVLIAIEAISLITKISIKIKIKTKKTNEQKIAKLREKITKLLKENGKN